MALCSIRLRRALSSLSRAHRCLCSPVPVATEAPASAPRSSLASAVFSPSLIQLRLFRSSPLSLMSNQSRYSNINDADKIDPDTILFEGCDYNHWLITMDFPKDPKPTPEEMVRTYEETCAKGLKISVEEAKQRMYACSTTTYQGFQAVMTEAESEQFRGVPGVVFILPDSYIDPQNKEYGGDKYENGFITPRPPPVQYRRQGGGGGYNRNRNNFDEPRYDRQGGGGGGGGMPNRQGNPQQYGGPPSSYPPQQNYGPPPNYPPQQNQGAPMQRDASNHGQPRPNYPPQQSFGQPQARDTMPTNYGPPGRDGFQGNYTNQMRQNPNNYYNQGGKDMPPVQNNYSGNNLNYSPPAEGRPLRQSSDGGGYNGQANAVPYGQGGNFGSGSYGQGGYSAQGEPQRSYQAEERNDVSGAQGTYQQRY